ncbi:MAG: hypothetical protein K1X64_06205 [Myxococcaceae bacterium]|nr:hypothetical protein [Myxococcaceae bacterium]
MTSIDPKGAPKAPSQTPAGPVSQPARAQPPTVPPAKPSPSHWRPSAKPIRPAELEALKAENVSLVKLIGRDLEASLDNVLSYLRNPALFNPDTAARDLKLMYALMLSAKPEQVDLTKLGQPGHARNTLDKVFALQQALAERIASFGAGYTREIADELRNIDRALHYLGDTILLTIPNAAQDGAAPALAKEIPHLHWTADAAHQSLDDLPDTFFVLVDGGSEVSDTIKTATAVDAFVSHVAMVTREKDPTTGKTTYWMAEATSSRGVYVHPLDPDQWFQKNVRSMIHVPTDARLQKAFDTAGPKWLKEAYRRQQAGDPIPYNFAMDLADDSRTFCSQLPLQVASLPEFKAVMGDQPVTFPRFASQLQTGDAVREVLHKWGISAVETVAPGDFSIDPAFMLVATARALPNSKLAHDINRGHMRSAVFSTMINDWMQQRGYRLRTSNTYLVAAAVALGIRRTPFLGDLLLGKVMQPGMTSTVIASVLDIDSVTTLIYHELEAANEAFHQKNLRYMTFEEMKGALEKIRLDDLARYRAWLNEYRYDSTSQDAQENYPRFSLALEPPQSLVQ